MSVREALLLRRRREFDERRRYLAKLELLGERLQTDAEQLCAAIAQAGAAGGAVAAEPLIHREFKLSRSLDEIGQQIAAARAAVAAAELQLRRHELAAMRGSSTSLVGRAAARRFRSTPPRR